MCSPPPPQSQQYRLLHLVSMKTFLEKGIVCLMQGESVAWVILNIGLHKSIQPKADTEVNEPY